MTARAHGQGDGRTFSEDVEDCFPAMSVLEKCLGIFPWAPEDKAQISLGARGEGGGWPEGLISWAWIKNYNNPLINDLLSVFSVPHGGLAMRIQA